MHDWVAAMIFRQETFHSNQRIPKIVGVATQQEGPEEEDGLSGGIARWILLNSFGCQRNTRYSFTPRPEIFFVIQSIALPISESMSCNSGSQSGSSPRPKESNSSAADHDGREQKTDTETQTPLVRERHGSLEVRY
jgi:hypothetical protein